MSGLGDVLGGLTAGPAPVVAAPCRMARRRCSVLRKGTVHAERWWRYCVHTAPTSRNSWIQTLRQTLCSVFPSFGTICQHSSHYLVAGATLVRLRVRVGVSALAASCASFFRRLEGCFAHLQWKTCSCNRTPYLIYIGYSQFVI